MIESPRSQPEKPDRTDMKLWRVMDFTKYVSMLHYGALFFSRADQLPDPFEGARSCRGPSADGRFERDEALRKKVFLNSWHRNEHESAAMWRIYLSSDEGVAVQSSIDRVRACLEETEPKLHFGEVRYLDYDKEAVAEADELSPFFCKRKYFEYEQEWRVAWRVETRQEEARTGRYLELDLEDLIDRVVISPSAEPWLSELVDSVTQRYGVRLPVAKSSMLELPVASG